MRKSDLRKVSGVSSSTMTKMRRDVTVMLSVLDKICKPLVINFGDIAECVADEKVKTKMSSMKQFKHEERHCTISINP